MFLHEDPRSNKAESESVYFIFHILKTLSAAISQKEA